jgi:cysteinyl-tRNA synthetase
MATRYLGVQFDIHTGAVDLIFPHHEDEIAQSRGVSGIEPVRYWVHGEFLSFNYRRPSASGESEDEVTKMSRSKGNVVLLSDLKAAGYEPMAFRYLLLTAHYRSKLTFTDDSIEAAQNGLNNLRADLAALPAEELHAGDWSDQARRAREAFHTAINDDLDLPVALSITREAARNSKIAPGERRRLILDFDRVLGLRLDTVQAAQPKVVSEEALALVRERDAARAARDWKRSDELRDRLIAMGYEVRDTAKGTELV